MRISDWSSDVCSSDLIGANGVAIIRRKNGAGPVILLPIAASAERQRMLPHRLIVAVDHMGERQVRQGGEIGFRAKIGPIVEIGRASCRERVCQYVLISVVAVSFKKTNLRQDPENIL